MTCYRFLLAQPDRTGFLDEATIDQDPAAVLVAHEYRARHASELWLEPWSAPRLVPAND
ncbi:hypothetical protein [Allosphingosinicella sp.]|jgi:hypothetical protein|uniref:hypothetical protein n=1 Tax=Allosphingosinicella sp. TaxID=2823234 RepID=UPI002EF32F6F